MTLEEELSEAYRTSGATAALARYHELRDRYYGAGAYDFREGALSDFADELAEGKDHEGAIAVLRLNASEFPQSSEAWESLAEAYRTAGNRDVAAIYYRKSLEIDPQNGSALEKLRKLEEKKAP